MIRDAGTATSLGIEGGESNMLSSIKRKANAALSSFGTLFNTSSMSNGGGGSGGGRDSGIFVVRPPIPEVVCVAAANSGANVTEGARDEDIGCAVAGKGAPVGADRLETSVGVESETTYAIGV
jgi:hypothetical protein